MQDCRSGFSLLELAMVLVISGLMMSVVIKALPLQGSDSGGVASGSGASGGSSGQYGCTRERIAGAREAIENFARVNKRLPMPAARNIGVEDANYGREAIAASIVQAGGVSFGALPFQALGLPTTIAGDCWGNKFSYAVTTALTTSATSGGFMDDTVKGNITLKSTLANTNSTIIAYAIIGHGEDALGAVKLNHTAGNGWCAGAALKHLNCAANDAVLADGIFNNGAGAGANYFDDMVMAAGKPLITVAPTVFKTYCWGDNSWGQQANGTYDLASPQLTPRLIPLPGGVTSYSSVSVGPWDRQQRRRLLLGPELGRHTRQRDEYRIMGAFSRDLPGGCNQLESTQDWRQYQLRYR
ncbi:MAG: prepilin-type N-terminal cleavage/methylation domain-containing protein [Rickettsiales bacterium]